MPTLSTTSVAEVAATSTSSRDSPWWLIAAILTLCAIGALYGRGLQDLWSRRGTGDTIAVWRALAFAAGLATVAAALTGPIHDFAETSLTGHMTQHMVLIVVAAPLLASGGSVLAISLALPHGVRRRLHRIRALLGAQWLRRPVNRALVGTVSFTGVLWVWHLPVPYVLAVDSSGFHALEHFSFLMAAWSLWAAILTPNRHRLTGPLGFLLLFVVAMTGAALGAVLTFAPAPLYPASAFGESTNMLADQQLAGLIMWIPMDVVLLGAALSVFGGWLVGLQRRFPEAAYALAAAGSEGPR